MQTHLNDRWLPLLKMAFAAFCAAALIGPANAQDLPSKPAPGVQTSPETLKEMAEKLEAFRIENEIPSIAVAIVHRGKIIFQKGLGYARLAEEVPATAHTQYSIASVSKVFTAAGLMRLVEEGKVDLDRPVNHYLGNTPLRSVVGDAVEITVRHVVTHTAGLQTYWHFVNKKDPLGIPSRATQIVRYGVAMVPPGERHIYSNLGFGVLARLIEVQSGMPFETFMQREIFEPLGMWHTTMGPDPARKAALTYSGRDEYTSQPLPEEPGQLLATLTPLTLASGHYHSTVHDLARFAIFNLKHPLKRARAPLSHATLDAMHTPEFYHTKYYAQAIAWETIEDDSGVLAIEHAGGGPGIRSRLELFPQDDLAIALLVNDTRVLALLHAKRVILEALKPGFYDYRRSRFQFPLEDDAVEEAAESPTPELSETEKKARWLRSARALAGVWKAEIGRALERHSMTLAIQQTGEIFVDFDETGLPSVLTRTELSPNGIGGVSLGQVSAKFPWRNAPHSVRLNLDIVDDRIRGQVEFRSYADLDETSIYSYYSISHWAEFERSPVKNDVNMTSKTEH